MNEHDKRNLKFLMSLSDAELIEFITNATEDDLLYVSELFDQRNLEIAKHKEMCENKIYECVSQNDIEIDEFPDAKKYLSKFKLKKIK